MSRTAPQTASMMPVAMALAVPTQPTIMAGTATTIAKKEFQKPSAERSSRRSPSTFPSIKCQAPVSDDWMSFAESMMRLAYPNQSSMNRW